MVPLLPFVVLLLVTVTVTGKPLEQKRGGPAFSRGSDTIGGTRTRFGGTWQRWRSRCLFSFPLVATVAGAQGRRLLYLVVSGLDEEVKEESSAGRCVFLSSLSLLQEMEIKKFNLTFPFHLLRLTDASRYHHHRKEMWVEQEKVGAKTNNKGERNTLHKTIPIIFTIIWNTSMRCMSNHDNKELLFFNI